MGSSYQEEFEEIFRSKVTREGSAAFLEWLSKTDFFTAPASTKFHCACPCGLVQHSVSVYRTMVERYFDPETDSEENARLRELLNLRPQSYQLELESAAVTERTVTNWTSSLTLNVGTDHGVEAGDCVIDETYALVGVVSEVGLNWCTVLTLVDTDTSIGAQVFRTKDLGLAVGDFTLMREDRLRLDYLPADCQLLGGDLVVTSGLGGYYPSGLSIGTVEEVQLSDSGAASYAVLAPSVDFGSLVEVFVIKSFDIQT